MYLEEVGCSWVSLVGCAGAGEKTGTYIDDSWITTKVKSDLLAAKDVQFYPYQYHHDQGSSNVDWHGRDHARIE